ncbi:unnamed protein product, partial [Rotaria sordida]
MGKKEHFKSTASGSSASSTANKSKKPSTEVAAASSVSTTTMARSTVPLQPARRIIQNFLLVWLDANIDESKEDFQ